MIRFLAIVLIYIASPALACEKPQNYIPIAEQKLDSVFYKIVPCEGKPSYILGTFHTSDPTIIATISYTKPYLQAADSALFELKKSPEDATIIAQSMLLPATHQEGLRALIGKSYFNQLLALLKPASDALPAIYVNRYKPWAANILLQTIMIDISGTVMDDALQQQAKRIGITVAALESLQEQFDALGGLSEADQIIMLKDTIDNFDSFETLNERLLKAYRAGDLDKIAHIGEESFAAIPHNIRDELETALVTNRNQRMTDAMLPYVVQGNNFTAIGALHLPGEKGMLQLLENEGYSITPIHP